MDYELAKELKEAGWRQEYKPFKEKPLKEEDYITYPTLSELIEACGGKIALDMEPGWCNAGLEIEDHPDGHSIEPSVIGKTPEEAVARLWIKIAGKKNS